jgi:hypothetical protein
MFVVKHLGASNGTAPAQRPAGTGSSRAASAPCVSRSRGRGSSASVGSRGSHCHPDCIATRSDGARLPAGRPQWSRMRRGSAMKTADAALRASPSQAPQGWSSVANSTGPAWGLPLQSPPVKSEANVATFG